MGWKSLQIIFLLYDLETQCRRRLRVMIAAFLDRCREKNLKLTPNKVKLRLTEIPYMGHKLTAHRVQPDPSSAARPIECSQTHPR